MAKGAPGSRASIRPRARSRFPTSTRGNGRRRDAVELALGGAEPGCELFCRRFADKRPQRLLDFLPFAGELAKDVSRSPARRPPSQPDEVWEVDREDVLS